MVAKAAPHKKFVPTGTRRLLGGRLRSFTAITNKPERCGKLKRRHSDNTHDDNACLIDKVINNEIEQQYGKKGPVLGQGNWGTIHLYRKEDAAWSDEPAEVYAVKTFHKWADDGHQEYEQRVLHEFLVGEQLKGHPNVIDMLGLHKADDESDSLLIALSYCGGGREISSRGTCY